MANILLIGYYGYDNFGDEWLLRLALKRLSHHAVKVLHRRSSGLHDDKHTHKTPNEPQLSSINRWNIVSIITAIYWADELVFGGGSLLQDRTSRKSIIYYAALLMLAKCLKTPVYLMGQGLGPLQPLSKWMLSVCMPSMARIECRDQQAYTLATHIWPRVSVALTRDLTSDLPPIDPVKPGVHIGFSGQLTPLIQTWLQSHSYRSVVANPRDENRSDPIVLVNSLRSNGTVDWDVLRPEFETLSCIVSMRYHTLMIARLAQLPVFGISDDPKVMALCEELQVPCLSPMHLTIQTLQEAYDAIC